MSTPSSLHTEIAVIGAGPGGAACASALAQLGHEVVLLDQAAFPRDKTCGDGLTPMAVKTLEQMSLLDEVKARAPAHIDDIRIVGPFGVDLKVSFADFMEPDAAYALVLPRYVLDDLVLKHALADGARLMSETRVENISRKGDRICALHGVTPGGPIDIYSDQVVIATGASMGLLERTGFLHHRPRLMKAARAYFSSIRVPSNRYDFFFDLELLPGYGWIFPTGDGRANVGAGTLPSVWGPKQTASSLLKSFLERREREGLLQRDQQQGPIKGYPLRIDFPAERVAGQNWIIIGEAAGLVNPITGEGIDLALESGLLGAGILHEDLASGRSDHIPYQRELWHRFGPLFTGLHFLRDILVNPIFMDYILWVCSQHRFLNSTVMRINQGIAAPQDILHPLFILQFFMPLSPVWLARRLGASARGHLQWVQR